MGRNMIVAAERFILAAGHRRVVTNAAIDAIQFYSRLGYDKGTGTTQVKVLANQSFRCRNG